VVIRIEFPPGERLMGGGLAAHRPARHHLGQQPQGPQGRSPVGWRLSLV